MLILIGAVTIQAELTYMQSKLLHSSISDNTNIFALLSKLTHVSY